MRVIQIIPRKRCRLYGLMVQKEIELAKRNVGTFRRSASKQKGVAKWAHSTYPGWVWLERGLGEVVLAELDSRSSNQDEWQLLHAFLGFVDRHFGEKIAAINIQYVPEKFVIDQGILLEYSQDIAPARGTSAGGKITLLPGQAPAEDFSTLAHEVAHELMHRDARRASTSKRSRETEAEAVAFVVCQATGLETGSAAQDYIQLYEGDAKLLSESLEYIQHTATRILDAIGAGESSAPPV